MEGAGSPGVPVMHRPPPDLMVPHLASDLRNSIQIHHQMKHHTSVIKHNLSSVSLSPQQSSSGLYF